MTLDLSGMDAAMRSLDDALAILRAPSFADFDTRTRNTLEAGVIQNFEFCFELASKMIKRQLEQETEDAAIDALPWREAIRLAAERGLLDDPEHWFDYRRKRNITSHTYDRAKALAVLAVAVPFRDDARALLRRLHERNDD